MRTHYSQHHARLNRVTLPLSPHPKRGLPHPTTQPSPAHSSTYVTHVVYAFSTPQPPQAQQREHEDPEERGAVSFDTMDGMRTAGFSTILVLGGMCGRGGGGVFKGGKAGEHE
ncbi:hypothetical protein BDV95DRAFT_593837 [Massariosphaeria phaeospora]|uniref:Uncharacterized protein n=1 Tax=Massariosphaeria phaeospora TaxID=100035 RepID=A0A7C8I7A5_9PLEO|nr:hypothetical protein BDV95DRAFT_593837 [Massariosphaeria phaeospora]